MRQRTRIYGRSAQLGAHYIRISMVAHRPVSFNPWFRRGFPLRFSKIEKPENLLFVAKIPQKAAIWACSAVGSALHSHCRGRRFESDQVHHFEKNHRQIGGDFCLTTIIPQTEENSDHFWDPQAVSSDTPRLRVFVLYACWSRQFCSDLIVVSQQVTGGDFAGINQYANADRQNSSEISRYPYRAAFSFLMAYSPLICHMYCLNYFYGKVFRETMGKQRYGVRNRTPYPHLSKSENCSWGT